MTLRPNYFLNKFFTTNAQIIPKICIVGAGTAGFYAAQQLIKKLKTPQIDIIEKLPVPFGLVRFGVAPDHPEVKNVVNTFTKVAENPCVRFLGNVKLGTDVTLKQLRDAYHVVLLTYGANESKKLDIPGENLKNVIEARRIVGWYNGTPWDKDLDIDLSGETATIFGQGNVAIDVARILLSDVDELKKTDITEYALEALSKSKIKTVYFIGRRGPLQAAFTIKELREMLKLPSCSTIWRPEDFVGISEHLANLSRQKKRITELMLKSLEENNTQANKEFKPIFFRSPLELVGTDKVEKVILGINKLEGEDILKQKAVLLDKTEELNADLAIPSIGYRSMQVESSIPFDFKRGVVQNNKSRVDKGLYVSGWLGTGPIGVILSTMGNAFEVADTIVNDINSENLVDKPKGGYEDITNTLIEKNIQVISWQHWEKIDKYEQDKGVKLGKPREKVVDIDKMLRIADSSL
ncbi:NADPH:adrenodoxin oxidoreductase, mitochondrial [Diorhabda carinulata]|uniref:NADPH:adrenodoxin oxidoreductase, mitochondrial n=1 Tax=Diorhabda carinulata TaxID=1163345 RepID=UPI0025A2A2A4|nr:NADPH:adrenodoxin oxidoreductase, mitochondrial [Diorhabda carinulata]